MATVTAKEPGFNLHDENVPYLELYLGFNVIVYLVHLYLDIRQLRVLRRPEPPAALAGLFTAELYRKTQAYSLDKWWFSAVHSAWSTLETCGLILLRGLPGAWGLAERAVAAAAGAAARAGLPPRLLPAWAVGEVGVTVVFVLLLFLVNMGLELPWGAYSTFVIEQRHGFNKQTRGLYAGDLVKQVLIAAVLLPPIVGVVTHILMVSGPLLPLYLWGFLFALSLLLMTAYPLLIAPLFNKYEPLPEGSLRTRIEALAGALCFPLRKLYRVDGSRRSGHSNAYMYGFFSNKRIVLYDTLLEQCSEEQVVAVLAHELGHWKLRHTPMLFTVNQAVLLAQFCLFTLIRSSAALPAAFGFPAPPPAFVALILFQFVVAPLDEVISYLSNVVSRTFEFQADAFAAKTGHGPELRAALLRMEEENKGAMHVDPWYSALHYSHPPLVDRLAALDAAAGGQGGKQAQEGKKEQ
ncbi:hypothetical protein HYH03_008646 [Edaphochlamys debaryana]|uniref:CAAX prenyl protease n=1 Tax=Edaphochlamys debaryana TaxID=47281 RepID=A0A835Y037_9CHLO|nr:hypothetical protein HYH03_008646 [Edaphochlamys debaryana]|eukprot:KAG2493230.1 hypothetical protein HYH03_008646 [Edaphochlamys debaryana]